MVGIILIDLIKDNQTRKILSLLREDKNVMFTLIDLLKEKDPEIRCGVIGQFYNIIIEIDKVFFLEIREELKNRLLTLLNDENPLVRAEAINGIFNIDNRAYDHELSEDKSKFLEDVIPLLIETSYELLNSKGTQGSAATSLRDAAFWYLEVKGDYEKALKLLSKLARNSNERIREHAIYFAEDYIRVFNKDHKILEKMDRILKEIAGNTSDKTQ